MFTRQVSNSRHKLHVFSMKLYLTKLQREVRSEVTSTLTPKVTVLPRVVSDTEDVPLNHWQATSAGVLSLIRRSKCTHVVYITGLYSTVHDCTHRQTLVHKRLYTETHVWTDFIVVHQKYEKFISKFFCVFYPNIWNVHFFLRITLYAIIVNHDAF